LEIAVQRRPELQDRPLESSVFVADLPFKQFGTSLQVAANVAHRFPLFGRTAF
jgi:hypothetical protein